ncbi:hypothetical protein LJC40_02270 [Synergistaceae bacterium OttesenSCG-928-D05]|nr:hypothetical protein [Synergistaceae bacterium OttesenSCG-928-D05]
MIQVKKNFDECKRIQQGDIIAEVEFLEKVYEDAETITIQKILFPTVITLTQDCDLTWDYDTREKTETTENHDKQLVSAIVAPLYNYEHFMIGEHLSDLNRRMTKFPAKKDSTINNNLRKNEIPRYHYLEFDENIQFSNSVIDFKHYFSVDIDYLLQKKAHNYIFSVEPIYREHILQRFANYISRIGLP